MNHHSSWNQDTQSQAREADLHKSINKTKKTCKFHIYVCIVPWPPGKFSIVKKPPPQKLGYIVYVSIAQCFSLIYIYRASRSVQPASSRWWWQKEMDWNISVCIWTAKATKYWIATWILYFCMHFPTYRFVIKIVMITYSTQCRYTHF